MTTLQEYKKLAAQTRKHIQKLLAYRAGANQVTLGFLDGLEEEYEEKLATYKNHIRILTPLKEGEVSYLISPYDIAQAKLVPISMFFKVPASKKVLCLFHSDKNPSMHIYGNSYHCFVCSASGTTIDIVMKMKGVSFIQAVKFLIHK